MGNFIDDNRNVISMMRGCNFLPFGGVDACQQQVIFGMRIVTCYCYSDYCNGAVTKKMNSIFKLFLFINFIFLIFFKIY